MVLEFEIRELAGVPGQPLDYFSAEFKELFENFGWELVHTSWDESEKHED